MVTDFETETGQIIKKSRNKGYESVSRDMLQDEKMSLEAKGLLAYLCSLPGGWKVHKTFLYKCFEKNKKRNIQRIWNELVECGYILSYRRRNGRKYEYKYFFNDSPFGKEEIEEYGTEMKQFGFEFWDAQNEHLTVSSSKRAGNKSTTKKFITKTDDDEKKSNKKEVVPALQEKLEIVKHYLCKHGLKDREIDYIVSRMIEDPSLLNGAAIDRQMKYIIRKLQEGSIYDLGQYFIGGLKRMMEYEQIKGDAQSKAMLLEALRVSEDELPTISLFNWLTGEEQKKYSNGSANPSKQ